MSFTTSEIYNTVPKSSNANFSLHRYFLAWKSPVCLALPTDSLLNADFSAVYIIYNSCIKVTSGDSVLAFNFFLLSKYVHPLNVHLSLPPRANTGSLLLGLKFSFFLPWQVGFMSWEKDWSLHTMATIPWGARPSEVPILQRCTSPSAASPALGLGMSLLTQTQKRSSPSAPCWLVVREILLLHQQKEQVSAKLLLCPKAQ